MNIVTIMLSTSVGATMVASNFLKIETLKIILLGLIAFGISTVGGLIGGNIMCKLSGKKVALFGSYGWGDGEWMREWAERVRNDGAVLVNDEGLIANETPDDAALADCKDLGAKLAE